MDEYKIHNINMKVALNIFTIGLVLVLGIEIERKRSGRRDGAEEKRVDKPSFLHMRACSSHFSSDKVRAHRAASSDTLRVTGAIHKSHNPSIETRKPK
jgi:hypothetical protein